MPEKLEHRKIDPRVCPRCGGMNTENLGDDGTTTETHACLDCQKQEDYTAGGADYDVSYAEDVEAVRWCDPDGTEHEVWDSDYLTKQAADKLFHACVLARRYEDERRAGTQHADSDYATLYSVLTDAIAEAKGEFNEES